MNKYEKIIYWSEEDNLYIAEVPELKGCMAHGETEELALKNINEASELWLETARENNFPIPEPKGRQLFA